MKFSDFMKEGKVKKSYIDHQLIKSLNDSIKNDLKFLENIKIDEISARKIIVNYYDTLRSILEAIAVLNGYKIYAHEAFTYFLKELDEPVLANKFDRFRKLRNGINYYGKYISPEEAEKNKKDILDLIQKLRNKYLTSK